MTNLDLLKRFLGYVLPYLILLIPAFICMIILAATNGAMAFSVQPILDDIFIGGDSYLLAVVPLMIFGIFALRGGTYFVQSYFMQYVQLKVIRTLQVELYKHMLTLDMSYYSDNSTGGFISRITYDTGLLGGAAASTISNILREGFTVFFLLWVLFYRDPELAAMALIGLPASGYLVLYFGRRVGKLSKSRQEMMEGVLSHLEQTFSGVRIVKAFCMESFEGTAFHRVTEKVLTNQLKTAKLKSMTHPAMDLVAGIAISGVILYGGSAVTSGEMTTGTFFSFITALLMAYTPIKRFSSLNNDLQSSLAAARRVFEMLDTKPLLTDLDDAVALPPMQKSIRFEDVVFSYDSTLKSPVLNHINLEVKRGDTVALVGSSGAGKTTLVHLVPRFFDVTSGAIKIDDLDIRICTMESVRSQIAMVTQEIILFNDTVKNNIAYGHADSPIEKIEAAAAKANALDFIRELPDGFDTVIGDRGIKLSGGQRQRLSIARSLFKNAPILILDEATSALDTESEIAVQTALERLMKGRTTIVIAHQLSTIRNADRIITLKDGAIVEEGSHEELITLNGEYARIYKLQFDDKNG